MLGDPLAIALAVAALLAGLTGTWSPCGFSMIETLGPTGHSGGRGTTLAACTTFALGALAGGAATFGALSALGALAHGAGDRLAYLAAAAIAAGGAIAELRATAIVPQVRRQLPEHWRRVMPMPIAGALYGVLLGLGFTTFVLTLGVWALAAIAFAVGDPAVGLAVGLAFGAGRALPISLVAPIADRPVGLRVTELMADRPSVYRGFRLGDGLALAAVAAVLVSTAPAGAAEVERDDAADPSAGGDELAYQLSDRRGVLRRGEHEIDLAGGDPALGGGRVAVIAGDEIVLKSAVDLTEQGRFAAPAADALALSEDWIAWRAGGAGDAIRSRAIDDPAAPGPEHVIATAGGASQLGRPSLDGGRLAYAKATKRRNKIVVAAVAGGKKRTLVRSVTEGLSNPAVLGKRLAYVRHTRRADRLKLIAVRKRAQRRGGRKGRKAGRTLLSRRRGTLWSTALTPERAYVTLLRRGEQKILSAKR